MEKETSFSETLDYNLRMLLLDAQTSGGLFMAIKEKHVANALNDLKNSGYFASAVVGEACSIVNNNFLRVV